VKIPNINELSIKVRIEVFEAWGYKLKTGQKMIVDDIYPCEFVSKRIGKWVNRDDMSKHDVVYYKVRFTKDTDLRWKKGDTYRAWVTELHVEVPVQVKKMPHELARTKK
jgi:hypothetical protein